MGEVTMTIGKLANGSKTVNKASIQCGWNWLTCAKPMLPGCPDWCPATHFGLVKKGKMKVQMKDEDKWMTFEEGDAYFVPPGHLPTFPRTPNSLSSRRTRPTLSSQKAHPTRR